MSRYASIRRAHGSVQVATSARKRFEQTHRFGVRARDFGRRRGHGSIAIRENVAGCEHGFDEASRATGASDDLGVIHLDEEHRERTKPRERGIARDELEERTRAADGTVLAFVVAAHELEEHAMKLEQL
jgi:hypothetical protein